jgi:hypothetical protein
MTPSLADSSRIVRPSSQPGRFHGTQATLPPQISSTSFSPSAAQASAMTLSGCRWSTCACSTSACIGVSIEGAAPPDPCAQKAKRPTISSSCSTPW